MTDDGLSDEAGRRLYNEQIADRIKAMKESTRASLAKNTQDYLAYKSKIELLLGYIKFIIFDPEFDGYSEKEKVECIRQAFEEFDPHHSMDGELKTEEILTHVQISKSNNLSDIKRSQNYFEGLEHAKGCRDEMQEAIDREKYRQYQEWLKVHNRINGVEND